MKNGRELWSLIERHSRAITVIPVLLGFSALLISGRILFFQLGVVWFLGAISLFTAVEGFLSFRRQHRHDRMAGLATLLQFGGYSLCAANVAAYFAVAMWTSYRLQWLVYLMFTGLAMLLASALVPRRAKRKPST